MSLPQVEGRLRPYAETIRAENAPQEPVLSKKIAEAIGYAQEVRDAHASIRGVLFGEGEDSQKQGIPTSIEGAIRYLCTELACLAGESKTILCRL